jgi:nucleoside-diphosphate-sugar epimerase
MTTELIRRGYVVTRCDITLGWDALDLFREHDRRYDLVVHAAAAEPHRAAIDGRPMNLATNLMLDSAMFDWAVRTEQRRVLYLSSSAAYPVDLQNDLARPVALHEAYILGPRFKNIGTPDAAYGWTKLTGEKLAVAASNAGLPVHIVRPFSGYGEDQDDRWPFGAFAARARRREDPFAIWGSGEQVRDWIHVSDVVAGALAVVEADERRPVNLCTGRGTSMAELVDLFCKHAGYTPEIQLLGDRPAGVAYRVGDPARFNEHYTAKVSIQEGVERALG